MCSPFGVHRKTSDNLIVHSNGPGGKKLIFSGEFGHSQPSFANCLVNVIQRDIRSPSKCVLYILSLVIMQNSCLKVVFFSQVLKNAIYSHILVKFVRF